MRKKLFIFIFIFALLFGGCRGTSTPLQTQPKNEIAVISATGQEKVKTIEAIEEAKKKAVQEIIYEGNKIGSNSIVEKGKSVLNYIVQTQKYLPDLSAIFLQVNKIEENNNKRQEVLLQKIEVLTKEKETNIANKYTNISIILFALSGIAGLSYFFLKDKRFLYISGFCLAGTFTSLFIAISAKMIAIGLGVILLLAVLYLVVNFFYGKWKAKIVK
jgi:hypothetical protein